MSTTDWMIISQNDLQGEKPSGGFIRASCHIHGGDHQRSLAINEETGFGQCHNCGAQVLVREINPEAAANIERGQARLNAGEIKVRDPKYIKVEKHPPKPPTLERWQKEEVRMLREIQAGMERLLSDERAQAYLAQRRISPEIAKVYHVGYIPATLPAKYDAIKKWQDHIVFPVHHPEHGLQFAGRNLHLWQPGMDELEHKQLLEKQGIRRWRKTHASGWFNFQALEEATSVIFVEGAFDALALIEAGRPDTVAVIGTSVTVEWLPKQVERVALAFDSDESGIEKSEKARHDLYVKGYDVLTCCPPDDNQGEDWSERYRLHGVDGLAAVLQADPPVRRDEDFVCSVPDCGADLNDDPGCQVDENTGLPYCSTHWREIFNTVGAACSFNR